VDVRESYLAAVEEFRSEGRQGYDAVTGIDDEKAFNRYVDSLIARAQEETERPEGHVPDTVLWFVEENDWIGRLDIRHRLTPALLEVGGHIGYEVRPSARRRGHATTMLREALPIAARLGIMRVLITCHVDNVASRKVIEANGGILEEQRGDRLRFWVSNV